VGVLIGEVEKDALVTTSGARVGDKILLAKGVPIEATAIMALEKADELRERGYDETFIVRAQQYLVDPGISVVRAAQVAMSHGGVTAMHDPTEGGLATGLHELALAAQVGVLLHYEQIPFAPEGLRLCQEFGLDPLGAIASGALLLTVAQDAVESMRCALRAEDIPCAYVGDVVPVEEGVAMMRSGKRRPLPRYDKDEVTRLFGEEASIP
jgi:hydrogenase maturation factor